MFQECEGNWIGEIVVFLKWLKDETSADLTAFEKELNRKTDHQDLMKTETEEIFVLTKAIGEKETVALKLKQSAKETVEVAKEVEVKPKKKPKAGEAATLERQAVVGRGCRRTTEKQLGRRSKRNEPRKKRLNVVACTLSQRRKAAIQGGVKNFHLFGTFSMNVKVTDEDGFLSRSQTIKANNKIVKERI